MYSVYTFFFFKTIQFGNIDFGGVNVSRCCRRFVSGCANRLVTFPRNRSTRKTYMFTRVVGIGHRCNIWSVEEEEEEADFSTPTAPRASRTDVQALMYLCVFVGWGVWVAVFQVS